MTPFPASDASVAMTFVYGTSGKTESVNGIPNATNPRSVAIHWPQSSTINASCGPFGLTAVDDVGDDVGDAVGAAVGNGVATGVATGAAGSADGASVRKT
jgi:hypothetical protein